MFRSGGADALVSDPIRWFRRALAYYSRAAFIVAILFVAGAFLYGLVSLVAD